MSDKIIDFKNVKNKVKETDINKFEEYIYNLYYSVMDGSMNMVQFSSKIMEYMKENDISHEKFINIQKKFMQRYGFSGEDIDKELKKFGMNVDKGFDDITDKDLEDIRKSANFFEKYKDCITTGSTLTIKIDNDKNNISIVLEQENVVVYSHKEIDLKDLELNSLLISYKKIMDKELKITLCSNCIKYTY